MRVEDCIVSVERRTLGGCLDLAFLFTRQFALPIYRLMLVFAVPCCGLVWLAASLHTDMLIPSLILMALFTALYGGALVAAVGPQVFGVPMSTRAALRSLRSRLIPYLFLMGIARVMQLLTSFCIVFPAVLVTAWCGHLPETLMLERTPVSQIMPRLSWLTSAGGYTRNLGRVTCLILFWGLVAFGLLILFHLLSGALFHIEMIPDTVKLIGPDADLRLQSAALDSPLLLTTIQIALWLPYPVIRVAWFFCYLDQRIRNECWDLDLQFRVESIRLEEAA